MVAPSSHNEDLSHADPQDRPLRADARENRRRIVEAAHDTFIEHGLDVPLAEVVRRSGVGAATLYRRFPNRGALITEVFHEQIDAVVQVVLDAARDPDPWRGFCAVVTELCDLDVVHRGFIRSFLSTYPERVDVEEKRARAEREFDEIVRRAHEAGELRLDVGRQDLDLALMANGGLQHVDPEIRRAASHRLVAHLLRAFRSTPATSEVPAAVST